MLSFSGSLKVFVAVEACDMRRGFNGLHALVTERLAFMQELKSRMAGRFQLTTDAFTGYRNGRGAVREVFGNEIDFATETKIFGKPDLKGVSSWFNPMVVVGIKRNRRIGNADLSQATTCHAERMNL
jgi:hypothetical protein